MDRRDFLAAWIQALLLAIFPFLRARPMEQSRAIAEAYVDKMEVGDGWWINHAAWHMVRSYDMRWSIGQLSQVSRDELLKAFPYVPASIL